MNNDKNKKIDEILGSLDQCQRATVPNFFYTRLKARMENIHGNVKASEKRPLVLKPVYALIALAAVLIINAMVIFQNDDSANTENTVLSDTDSFQTFAVEYRLNDNSAVPYDINQ